MSEMSRLRFIHIFSCRRCSLPLSGLTQHNAIHKRTGAHYNARHEAKDKSVKEIQNLSQPFTRRARSSDTRADSGRSRESDGEERHRGTVDSPDRPRSGSIHSVGLQIFPDKARTRRGTERIRTPQRFIPLFGVRADGNAG